MKRIAFYGGSFDPVHRGHLEIAHKLSKLFKLDEFVLVPAFHAPHKPRTKPTSAYSRHAMLCLATRDQPKVKVSRIELEVPEKHYTIDTLRKLRRDLPADEILFVMGADSWSEITTWREWENVLSLVDIIVVTRPNYQIGFSHVNDKIREKIVDLRNGNPGPPVDTGKSPSNRIYITDAVQLDISSTKIRELIREGENDWEVLVSTEVFKYIKKYGIYV